MNLINESNVITKTFTNAREVLLTNSNGYKVTSSYSKHSSIPVIILEVNMNSVSQRIDGSRVYSVTVDVNCVGKTVKQATTLGQECLNLLVSSDGTFLQNNMDFKDSTVTFTPTEVEGNKVYNQIITAQFIVE